MPKIEIQILDNPKSRTATPVDEKYISTLKTPVHNTEIAYSSEIDQWVREAAASRKALRGSIPDLIRKPKFYSGTEVGIG